MALPWQKLKPVGVIVRERKPDGGSEEEMPKEDNGLQSCAEDILRAHAAKDASALASALQSFFQICESQPHDEGEHENDMDSLNAAAAEGE